MTTPATEKFGFQAEVNEVLSLVVNSLYSHREIFLRELISNASDALDHLAFRALTDDRLRAEAGEPAIEIAIDAEARTLAVRDNGVGMTRDEMIANLGTIARSGSKKLVQSLTAEQKADLTLIGQFGVGFYSAFLVADHVDVTSRAAGGDQAWRWSSDAKGEFTVAAAERDGHGTDVVLHLKEDAAEFLERWTVQRVVRKYSDYVRHPIRMRAAEGGELETVNTARALWARPKAEIEREQYVEFYKHVSHDWQPPLGWTHFKVEGTNELTGLLFVPRHPPFDLFDRQRKGLRLFVKRVFIMEDCEQLLPEWLRFLAGVVDSEDLPLNVSREILQHDRSSRIIRKQVVKHALGLLEEMAAEGEIADVDADGEDAGPRTIRRYEVFWNAFGRVLKEGIHYEPSERERIARLLRYRSTAADGWVSLQDYADRMQDGQPGIYFVTADSERAARGSPHIEALRARGYEVLLMSDPIDEWVVQELPAFADKKLIAAAKGALDLPRSEQDEKARAEQDSAFATLVERVQRDLGDSVSAVRLTERLTESPACLVTEEGGLSPQLERILRAQGQELPPGRRVLELNPDHPVVGRLRDLLAAGHDAEVGEWSRLLHDQALIAEGSLPDDPARLARAISRLMERASPA